MEGLTATRDERIGPPELLELVTECLGAGGATIRGVGRHSLGGGVHRLLLEVGGVSRSVVIKCSDPAMAHRNRMVAERWLPAVGLEDAGPPLLGIAAERGGRRVWQLYEDLGDGILDERAPDAAHVTAAAEVIALVHARFADHVLLAECRLWGSDFGIQWYASNVRDAMRALVHLRTPRLELSAGHAEVRDQLIERLQALGASLERRARVMADHGGRETLLHGDLWPKNAVVRTAADGVQVRLIDWDRAGVGPISYDLSTFLSRFPPGDREWILEAYRTSLASAGWRLPAPSVLNALFATAECARLANRVIWPAIAVSEGEADRAWAFGELASLAEWLGTMQPLLPQAEETSPW